MSRTFLIPRVSKMGVGKTRARVSDEEMYHPIFTGRLTGDAQSRKSKSRHPISSKPITTYSEAVFFSEVFQSTNNCYLVD